MVGIAQNMHCMRGDTEGLIICMRGDTEGLIIYNAMSIAILGCGL